jgi:co-chaperonin GroES (HSP10)
MTIRPLGSRILARPLDPAPTTAGGLHVPTSAREDAVVRASVIDYGEHARVVERTDTVLVRREDVTEVDLDGVRHLIVDEADVLGVERP